jgi:dimethylamine/trimethylamine dehydrogenase
MRDPRFDILFEPVAIGPVTARNRFFQVPQCSGMGYRDVSAHAEMRATKAEGGWAVVCTEQAEIHHSSEITPFIEQRIWDDIDLPALTLTVDRVHHHGSLAAIELCYNGMNGPNFFSRVAPMGPAHLPVASFTYDPVQARGMTLDDIADLRRWHRCHLRVRRACAWRHPSLSVAALQPPHRRVRRIDRESCPTVARAPRRRGGRGCGSSSNWLPHQC